MPRNVAATAYAHTFPYFQTVLTRFALTTPCSSIAGGAEVDLDGFETIPAHMLEEMGLAPPPIPPNHAANPAPGKGKGR